LQYVLSAAAAREYPVAARTAGTTG
jgi:hypothetical protein